MLDFLLHFRALFALLLTVFVRILLNVKFSFFNRNKGCSAAGLFSFCMCLEDCEADLMIYGAFIAGYYTDGHPKNRM